MTNQANIGAGAPGEPLDPSGEPETVDPAGWWPAWMLPARLVGRFRAAILASAAGDAIAINRHLPAPVRVAIPLLVVAIAAFAAASPLLAGFSYPAAGVEWLRFTTDFSFSDAPLFLLAALAIGACSPAGGVLLVLSYAIVDLPVTLIRGELTPLPMALLGRFVALWLLWLAAVEIPVAGRLLAVSVRQRAPNRVLAAAIAAVATGGLTWAWTQVIPVLIRPLYLWADGWIIQLSAVVPVQTAGLAFALVAGLAAGARVLLAGPHEVLDDRVLFGMFAGPGPSRKVVIARRLLVAALLTVALGGLITAPLDAVVLFVVLAGARPLARAVGRRTPLSAVVGGLPVTVQFAVASALSFGAALLLVGGIIPPLFVSEFFSLIVAFGIGLFLVELVTMPAQPAPPSNPGAAYPVVATLVLALLGLSMLAPVGVLADNCSGFADCWSSALFAALVAGAMPLLMAISAYKNLDDWLEKGVRERDEEWRRANPEEYRRRLHDGWRVQPMAANVPAIRSESRDGP